MNRANDATGGAGLVVERAAIAIEHRGLRVAIAKALLVATALFLAGAFACFDAWRGLAFHAAVVLLGSAIALLKLEYDPVLSPERERMLAGTARVKDGKLTFERDGRAIAGCRLDEIVEGWVDTFEGPLVVLRTRWHVLFVAVETDEGARALLSAACASAEHKAVRLPIASPMGQAGLGGGCLASALAVALPVVFVFALAGVLFSKGGVFWAAAATMLAVATVFGLLVRVLTPRHLVIGTDGISFRAWLRRRFVPFGAVEEVREHRRGVLIRRVDGLEVYLAAREGMESLPSGREEAAPRLVLLQRIREAMLAGNRGRGAEAQLGALDRDGSSLEAWRERLQRLVQRSTGYRKAALAPEDALAALEDASTPPERRIGAALALGSVDDGAMKPRIRRVIETCADDELRAALEAAAEDELAEGHLERVAAPRSR